LDEKKKRKNIVYMSENRHGVISIEQIRSVGEMGGNLAGEVVRFGEKANGNWVQKKKQKKRNDIEKKD
jgi:hypothetical protein